jgi:exodeoxyribonuclease V alpha subunit
MTMTKEPEICWLKDRYGLLDENSQAAARSLLSAERETGSTAHPLPADPLNLEAWGNAATIEPEANRNAPLVIINSDEGLFLQTRRCYLAERSIADRIRSLSTDAPITISEETIRSSFGNPGEGDLQVEAARTALRSKVTIITGGPGTGKTFTLARILTLLLSDGSGISEEKIALAAPTGKAADRMKGAIEASLQGIDDTMDSKLRKVARRSMTLHKLMGAHPVTGECRHREDNPLPWKLLIIDECSMVDIHLWKALLESLQEGTRLILLGDPKQLQSVGQGNVFADLAAHANGENSVLHGRKVHLTRSIRFAECPGISALAESMQIDGVEGSKGAEEAERLLLTSNDPAGDLLWIDVGEKPLDYSRFPSSLRDALIAVADAETPGSALDALQRICILTPHRNSFVGAETLSRNITDALAGRKDRPRQLLPPNEPVIINRNDPETGLRNGAVGVICADAQGQRRAWFRKGNEEPESYPLGALPDHSPAWAITIHRSQGSEYDQVFVILPAKKSVMATRELLYTAITRAKRKVLIAGSMEAVKQAVITPSERITLLKASLDRFV